MKRLFLFATLALMTGCAPATHLGAAQQPEARDLTCSSDLACRTGIEWCAKPYNSMTGMCVVPVDEHGLPVYAPPRPLSSWLGGAGCLWGRRCPMGFWCDQGTCVR